MTQRAPRSYEAQVWRLVLLVPLPALAVAFWGLWHSTLAPGMQWTMSVALVIVTLAAASLLQRHVTRPLRTISNMLAAIREQDYTMRARAPDPDDALGLAMLELNTLMDELRSRRLGALEASSLLRRVISEIDIAIFAFDDADVLRLVNRNGEQLLGVPEEQVLGRSAEQLGLTQWLRGEAPRAEEAVIAGRRARWELRRGTFRQDGRQHRFVLLADVSRALRAEERLAWERLIRVLGHEINNSLTPIASLSDRLHQLLARVPRADPVPDELRTHLLDGLQLISTRGAALSRFMASYTALMRLPAPTLASVALDRLVDRVVQLEARLHVTVSSTVPCRVLGDSDQLEQMLINLVRNAADAALATDGMVAVLLATDGDDALIEVRDGGAGIAETGNLFVPFFTTKPGGAGIGLVLSRQIAESHGGTVVLANRVDAPGCSARVRIPLLPASGRR